jgi:hypothetical protein
MKDIKQSNVSSRSKVLKPNELLDEKQLRLKLLQSPEDKIQDKFSDKNLDRRNEIELISGKIINLDEERANTDRIVATALKEYSRRVPQIYYREIFRLNNWVLPEGNISEKPSIVGRFTNEIIYSRFNKDVLPQLQRLNPYIVLGMRNFKHFQWLTEEGQSLYDIYIQNAISVMQDSTDWYDFRVKHSAQFGVTFQLNWEKDYERNKKKSL